MTGKVRPMLYRFVGFVTWRVLRGYLHHRFPQARRKIAIAGVAALVLAGAGGVAASRRERDSS
jgi:hypothetical protein